MQYLKRDLMLLKVSVEMRGKLRRLLIQLLLKTWPVVLQVIEHSQCGGHSQRMLEKGTGEQGFFCQRIRRVSKVPHAAVERIHVGRLASHNPDRHATDYDLAVGDQVCANVEPSLRASRMDSEAGDHLVEDQKRPGLSGQLPQFMKKCFRLHIWPATLYWLNQNSGQLVSMGFQRIKGLGAIVIQHQHIFDRMRRYSRSHGG